MKIKSLIMLLFLTTSLFAQFTYQGPAEGSIPAGYLLSTETAPKASNVPGGRTRLFLHNKPIVEPDIETGVDLSRIGENYFPLDDKAQSLKKADEDDVVIFRSFKGIVDNGYIPPDPTLAVGPEHIILAVNTEFHIVDKQGNLLAAVEATDWYNKVFQTESIADPKVIYDHFNQRWVIVWIDIHDTSSEAYFIISVSDDANPLGDWYTWWLPSHMEGNTPSGKWADYPGLGFDDKAIYITSNQFLFDGGGQYPLIRIIPKNYLYLTNLTPGEVKWFDIWDIDYPGENQTAWGLRPVHNYSLDDDYYFVATRWWGEVNTTVGIYRLKNSVTTPELEAISINTLPYEMPGDVEQLGGGEYPLEHNGVRLTKEPTYRDGILYITHLAKYKDVIGFRYLTVDVFSEAAYIDYILGTDEHYHLYPAIAANSQGDAVITYTRSSANEYAGAFFTVISGTTEEPVGTFTMQEGLANYVKDYDTERNRWGDYMGAFIDPTDDFTFWVHSQYVEYDDRWATWATGFRIIPFENAYAKVGEPSLDFGIGEVTKEGESRILKITNLGNEDLVINNFAFGSENFKVGSEITLPYSIPKLDTLSLEIVFNPQQHGIIKDTLTIESNSQISLDTQVQLLGEGFEITKVSQNIMYASTGRGAGSFGSVLTINTSTGEGVAVGEISGFKPLRSITINPSNNELVALYTVLGDLPSLIRLRANDGKGYEYNKLALNVSAITFDEQGVLHCITADNEYYVMDYNTLEATLVGEVPIAVSAMTYNPITNEIFVTSSETATRDRLYKLTNSGDTSFVTTMGLDKVFEAITFDNTGLLYGAVGRETQMSTLYSVNPSNGESAEIGAVGFRGVLGLTFAFDPAVNVDKDENVIPTDFALMQNYPNPFNPSTKINFSLPVNSRVKLTIYNMLGEVVEELINGELPPGYHAFNWNTKNKLSSGIYVYSIEAQGNDGRIFSSSKKMILLK